MINHWTAAHEASDAKRVVSQGSLRGPKTSSVLAQVGISQEVMVL